MSTLDDLLSGGAKSAKFTSIGDTVSGTIERIEVMQAVSYVPPGSGGVSVPEFHPSGDPKEKIVVVLATDERDDEDDDGERAVYIKGWGPQRKAFQKAAAEAHKPEVGDRFIATLVGKTPSSQGGNPANVFEYRIEALGVEAPQYEVSDARKQALKLIGMGTFTYAQVAAATALPLDEVRAMSESIPF